MDKPKRETKHEPTNLGSSNASREGKIGRGNPPRHTQFKKGTSGNIRGRPKGSKNLSTLVMEAANDTVTATIGGKPRKITTLQASIKQLAVKAAQGDRHAIPKLLSLVDEMERRTAAKAVMPFPFDKRDLEVLHATYLRMMEIKSQQEEN
jgi:hypothetical protein